MKATFKDFLLRLDEARADYVIQTLGEKALAVAKNDHSAKFDTADELINFFSEKISKVNIAWVVRMYIAKQFKVEDASRIKRELDTFAKFKSKLTNKDLNSYKSLDQLYDALEPFEGVEAPVSKKAEVKAAKSEGADVVLDTPELKVIRPKTEAAACLYGSGTKWCTAAATDNMFDHYNDQGDLYILIAKLDGESRKFQLHYETDSFLNERDTALSKDDIAKLSELPAYKQFLNMLIKKHYREHL